MPTPFAWWAADSVVGVADGAAVTTVPDSGPNGYTMTAPDSASAPAYKASGIGGKPALTFGGSASKRMVATAVIGSTNPTTYTIFSVGRTSQNGTGANTVLGSTSGGGLQYRWGGDGARRAQLIKQATAVVGNATTDVPFNTGVVTAVVWVGNASWAHYLNGTAAGAGSTAITAASGQAVMGNTGANQGEGFVGDLAEVIVYNRALSAAERTAVTTFLGSKYGVSTT